jgi:DnaJ-domain-containing protein 1
MRRLGENHWNNLPWDGDLGRDNQLKELASAEILNDSQTVLDDLDDLCVLLLFSVFEATIRERVLAEVEAELPQLRHVTIRRALDKMKEGIEQGSFFKVLEPYKVLDADLIEQVNQVRRYRNWVAHGRRMEQPAVVNPMTAYDRLKRFLDLLGA